MFTVTDNCVGVKCYNYTTCSNSLNSYTCVCTSKYTGLYCDTGMVTRYYRLMLIVKCS